ncbi:MULTISPECIES: hypothetical protein [unclassified Streptomyces]|uniref:hypothetical protein n=1 Tax=unclassified Streptomyces TaxID=2593676 RepID=UPI0033A752D7
MRRRVGLPGGASPAAPGAAGPAAGSPGPSAGQGGGASPYRTWADFLEHWARGDRPDGPGDLPRLDPGDLPADAWQRLLVRVRTAVEERLQQGLDAMVRDVNAARDEFTAGRALTRGRVTLRSVRTLLHHPCLPEDFRDPVLRAVDTQVQALQDNLEQGLARRLADGDDPRAVEARRRTYRDNPLTAVLADAPPTAPVPAAAPDVGGRRRIVRPG